MSTFHRYRKAIKDALRAQAPLQALGFAPNGENIIIRRKADMWSMFEEAVQAATHPFVIMIGVASGKRRDPDGALRFDVTLQIDYVVPNDANPDPEIEEEPWEEMVKFLDRWKPPGIVQPSRCYDELVCGDFRDFEWKPDPESGDYSGGATYGAMVRQTDFSTIIQL